MAKEHTKPPCGVRQEQKWADQRLYNCRPGKAKEVIFVLPGYLISPVMKPTYDKISGLATVATSPRTLHGVVHHGKQAIEGQD